MKKIAIITIVVILLAASWADARPGRGMNGGDKGALMMKFPGLKFYQVNQDELKLDDEQLEKMEQIDESFQKEKIDLQSKIKYAGLELKKELDKTVFSKEEVLKRQETIQNLKNYIQKRALEYRLDIYNVLTEEQKINLDKVKKSCMKSGMGSGSGRGHNRGKCDGSGQGFGW